MATNVQPATLDRHVLESGRKAAFSYALTLVGRFMLRYKIKHGENPAPVAITHFLHKCALWYTGGEQVNLIDDAVVDELIDNILKA